MRTSERLLARLKAEGIIPEEVTAVQIARTRSGSVQRARGAWSWFALWEREGRHGHEMAGSQWSMADCVRAHSWDVSQNEFRETSIDPRRHDGRYM